MRETIIVENTGNEIVEVRIDTTSGYVSISGNVYTLAEYDLTDRREYAKEMIKDVFDVDYFADNPDKTFNELVEELSDPIYFGTEIIETISFKVSDDKLIAWEWDSGGQIDPGREDLKEIWNKYHLETELTDKAKKEIEEVCNRIKQEVNQEYPF